MIDDKNIASDFMAEAVKGTPPVAVAATTLIGMVNWQAWVFILTCLYLVMQICFLGWKLVDKWRGKKTDGEG